MKHVSILALVLAAGIASTMMAADVYVSPAGDDANPGTAQKPVATLAKAQQLARTAAKPVNVRLREGTYYLPEPLVLTAADSGTKDAPVVWHGENAVVSGGQKLEMKWEAHKNGIFKARVPEGLATDQLFVNGQRQILARYPNFDPSQRIFNGFSKDAFSKERAVRWADPAGGFIHAMHRAEWGDFHYQITGEDAAGQVTYVGGWQNNRRMGMHNEHRFVENIFEELDAPGEWFLNSETATLYFYPPAGVNLPTAVVEVVRLRNLVEFKGDERNPVKFVNFSGITFRHAARTFMDNKEPLLRSDWTTYRGAAVFVNGAEDCTIENCSIDQVGGNAVCVNNYNRRITFRGIHIDKSGGNGIHFVGDPAAVRNPLFEYGQVQDAAKLDRTPGPKTNNYPADCLVEDCLIHAPGRVEKQTTAVGIDMARNITVRHCSIYDCPRAGINIGDGCWGGHIVEFCDIFDTVLETGDHGSFNSWGRDRYWRPSINEVNAIVRQSPELPLLDAIAPVILRNNRWRCDHGWDIDLDDGSSNYEIYNNLCLNGGLKNREGYKRIVTNNIIVNNSFHPHVWFADSGDIFSRNIVFTPYRPVNINKPWGKEFDYNLMHQSVAMPQPAAKLQSLTGRDEHSLVADAGFVDPANGDFRVKEDSPAIGLGFKNFPMDQFGVTSASLRKIARQPVMPKLDGKSAPAAVEATPMKHYWQGRLVRALEGEEYSAYGVAKDSGGVVIKSALPNSLLADDLIQKVNGKAIRKVADLFRETNAAAGRPLTISVVRNQAAREVELVDYTYVSSESAGTPNFTTLALVPKPLPIAAVFTQPKTANEPPATLSDGQLAANYGPVFPNGVKQGCYKLDLGQSADLGEVRVWSHNMGGKRGLQHFILYASDAPADPGWNVADAKTFGVIGEVDAGCTDNFLATSIRHSRGGSLGRGRWLVLQAMPVTPIEENTAFQEIQVLPAK